MDNKAMSQILNKRIESRDTNQQLDKKFNSLFGATGDDESERAVKIPITRLIPFNNQPFKPYSKEKLEGLAKSIGEQGLLNPIIVRKVTDSDNYEILCGHNRVKAYELLSLSDILSFIKDVNDDMAVFILTESNLRQREKLLPSEKSKAYKMQLDALKHQGKRTDLDDSEFGLDTSTQIAHRLTSVEKTAIANKTSKDEIRRYIRLTFLIPDLLDLVDEDILPLIAGVELSYLKHEEQQTVYGFFFNEKRAKLDLKLSTRIREFSKTNEITTEALERLIKENAQEHKKKANFTIKRSRLKEYSDILPDDSELERLFFEFLQNYKEKKIS